MGQGNIALSFAAEGGFKGYILFGSLKPWGITKSLLCRLQTAVSDQGEKVKLVAQHRPFLGALTINL